jgi:hypothetical protein
VRVLVHAVKIFRKLSATGTGLAGYEARHVLVELLRIILLLEVALSLTAIRISNDLLTAISQR